MKKYLLILFYSFAFSQASNQMVTFSQAQSLGFNLNAGQSHVTSNECMTKSQALSKYNLVSSAMSAYSANQLVPRSVWVTPSITYNPIYGYYQDPCGVQYNNLYQGSDGLYYSYDGNNYALFNGRSYSSPQPSQDVYNWYDWVTYDYTNGQIIAVASTLSPCNTF